jgi:hypothetical protein
MSEYHIAQLNIARMLASIEDPVMADFVAQLLPINTLFSETCRVIKYVFAIMCLSQRRWVLKIERKASFL